MATCPETLGFHAALDFEYETWAVKTAGIEYRQECVESWLWPFVDANCMAESWQFLSKRGWEKKGRSPQKALSKFKLSANIPEASRTPLLRGPALSQPERSTTWTIDREQRSNASKFFEQNSCPDSQWVSWIGKDDPSAKPANTVFKARTVCWCCCQRHERVG